MQAAVAVGVFSKGRLLVCVDIHTSLPLCRSPAPARLTESIAGLWGQALPMTCKANASEWQDVTVVLTDVSGSRQVFSKETPPMAPAKCISQTRLKRNIQLAKEELLGHHPTMVFFWDYLYWLAVWNIFYFPSYMGYSFPLTFIFFKMVKTTNQQIQFLYFGGYHQSLLAIIYHGTSFRKKPQLRAPNHRCAPNARFREVNNLVKRKGDADEKLRGLTVVSTEMAKCARIFFRWLRWWGFWWDQYPLVI